MQTVRNNVSPAGALLIGAITMCVAFVTSLLIVTRARDGDVVIISDPAQFEVVVEVRGAVLTPGVYRMPEDARLGDLLAAAGGARRDADLTSHNLARHLVDAEIIIIDKLGAATPVVAAHDQPPNSQQTLSFRININSASQAELESLPGIGPVIAKRIIDYRVSHGGFTSIEDLTLVEGISEKVLAEIQSLITIGP